MKRQSEMAALVLGWTLLIAVGYGNGLSQVVVVPSFLTEAACKAPGASRLLRSKLSRQPKQLVMPLKIRTLIQG